MGQLSEIARGLRYLHSESIVHGDFKDVGNACPSKLCSPILTRSTDEYLD